MSIGKINYGGREYNITDNVYSEEEHIVGVYVKNDGSKIPVYRIFINSTFAAEPMTNKSLCFIKNLDKVIHFEGYFTAEYPESGSILSYKFPFALNDEDISIHINQLTGEIMEVHNYDQVNGLPCYATIEYTKTTD